MKRTFAVILLLITLLFAGCSPSSESAQPAYLDTQVKWPKTGLAKKLPEPGFGQLAGITDEPDKFCAAFADVSQDDLRDYAEQAKNAGFTVDAATSDKVYMGIEMFSYSAENADGLIFSISGTAGTCTITLKEP